MQDVLSAAETKLQRLARKLATEHRGLRSVAGRIDEVHDFVTKAVADVFGKGRAIEGSSLSSMFERADRLIYRHINPLKSVYNRREASRGDPRGAVHEACHVVFKPMAALSGNPGTVFQLHSLRVTASQRRVEVECVPLPLAFRYHAAERLQQRSDVEEAALRQNAMDVMNWGSFVATAERQASETAEDMMVVPAHGQGLLLGMYDHSYALESGTNMAIDATGTTVTEVSPDPLAPAMFFAVTYISSLDMKDRQKELSDRLVEWKRSCGPSYEHSQLDTFWPTRHLTPTGGMGIDALHVNELEKFLSDRRVCDVLASSSVYRRTSKSDREYGHFDLQHANDRHVNDHRGTEPAYDQPRF